jgi:hypothetical protein
VEENKMKRISKDESVLSLRKKLMAQALVAVLVVAGIGVAGLMTSVEPGDDEIDMDRLLETLDLPQMAPYQASDGVLNGEGGYFGTSVSYAGDVNNDGKDDIIVGAPSYDGKGRVYIFFGDDGTPSTANVVITGGASGDSFGASVSGAGRYDDDSIDDIVIGATGDGASDEGMIYIFVGRSSWTGIDDASDRDYEATGENSGDNFGCSVSSAGDVDNDGDDEILVGATSYSSSTGKAYMFYGDDGDMSVWDQTWTGSSSGDIFGIVSSAGNVDGDSYDDIIIGAMWASSQYGQAYIYFGSVNGPSSSADVTITGESSSNRFGQSVSDAGNVNGDGYDDVIIGASGAGSDGKAYIFNGRSSWSSTYGASSASVILVGETDPANEAFGASVSSAGDYNKDNYDDVIVGSAYESALGGGDYEEAGRAHIFFGGSSMDAKVDVSMTGEASSDYFGWAVSNAGDYDDDGFDDVVVGAPYNDGPGNNYGRAYVYNFVDHVEHSYMGLLGYSVSSAGLFNNDAYYDVVVGDPFYEPFIAEEWGRAYVFHGGSSMDSTPDVFLTSPQKDAQFGFSVASGDFNDDGDGDILVGAPSWDADPQTTNVGRVYLYYGNDIDPADADVIITGENAGDLFGYSVSSAGKWFGNPVTGINDDYEDVLIGAPGYNSNAGRAYLFYGSGSMSSTLSASTADVTFSSHTNDEKFGFSVSGAGEFDNDVTSDADELIIGSPLFNSGFDSDAGRVYLYLGQDAVDPSTSDATFTGEGANDNFGHSVSDAGNMDNDNYHDIVVGAPKYGTGDKGRAYVFKGESSPSGDTGAGSADKIFTGQSDNDEFGYSVSSAGNVDNDNYDDIVIGAPKNDGGGTDGGRVYLFYGSSTLNNWDEVFITGMYANGAGEKKGWSVSCAGDVNNDNYDDVIIGAPYRETLVSAQPIPEGMMEVWGDPS